MIKDYYKTLNINRNSSQDDIKKAFRKLSKQHHPDKGGDETVFKELSEAYDTLSNPEKKQRYPSKKKVLKVEYLFFTHRVDIKFYDLPRNYFER